VLISISARALVFIGMQQLKVGCKFSKSNQNLAARYFKSLGITFLLKIAYIEPPLQGPNFINMKGIFLTSLICSVIFSSCTAPIDKKAAAVNPLKGSWKLLSATTVSKGESSFTDYTKDQEMIKIINDDHFAFLKHGLKNDKAGKNNFDAGGGRYTLHGDQYTEFLDYYSDKNWEGKSFVFTIKFKNDTLLQTGIEKVEAAGIDRTITEKYLRISTLPAP
jgi:hypothetical protein